MNKKVCLSLSKGKILLHYQIFGEINFINDKTFGHCIQVFFISNWAIPREMIQKYFFSIFNFQ